MITLDQKLFPTTTKSTKLKIENEHFFCEGCLNDPVPLLLPASCPQLHTSKNPDFKIVPSLAVLDVLFEDFWFSLSVLLVLIDFYEKQNTISFFKKKFPYSSFTEIAVFFLSIWLLVNISAIFKSPCTVSYLFAFVSLEILFRPYLISDPFSTAGASKTKLKPNHIAWKVNDADPCLKSAL